MQRSITGSAEAPMTLAFWSAWKRERACPDGLGRFVTSIFAVWILRLLCSLLVYIAEIVKGNMAGPNADRSRCGHSTGSLDLKPELGANPLEVDTMRSPPSRITRAILVAASTCLHLVISHGAAAANVEVGSLANETARQALIEPTDSKARIDRLRASLALDSDCKLARWYLGEVHVGNDWLPVAEAERQIQTDPRLAEYRKLRAEVIHGLRNELTLAAWCGRQGLTDAEQLHFYRVVNDRSAEPADRRRAMRHLGLQRYGGTLVTPSQLRQIKTQAARDRELLRAWSARVGKWRSSLQGDDPKRRAYALERLRSTTDITAIPALELLLSPLDEPTAEEVVAVLGSMPEHEATTSLVRHSVLSPWEPVRNSAIEQLSQRSLHDVAPLLLQALESPVETKFQIGIGDDGLVRHVHQFYREGMNDNLVVTANYAGGPRLVATTRLGIVGVRESGPKGDAARKTAADALWVQDRIRQKAANARRRIARRQASQAIQIERAVAATNRTVDQRNQRIHTALRRTAGTGPEVASPSAWWEWWRDYNEAYQYDKPTYRRRVGYADPYYVPTMHITMISCFPEGTKVRAATGLVDIQSILPGDRVLSQDVESGELAYKIVLERTERPASELIRISVGETRIDATKGHPFWVRGSRWRMAKRLNAGDQLHTLSGGATIDEIKEAGTAKAYNLVVADFGTYFVSQASVLVHDNSYRKPTTALLPGVHPNGDTVAAREDDRTRVQ